MNPMTALVLGLVSLAGAGCASFSVSKLPNRSFEDFGKPGTCALTWQVSEGGMPLPGESEEHVSQGPGTNASAFIGSRVEPIFRRSFVDSKRRSEPGEWHLDIYYRETRHHATLSTTLLVVCVATFGLVPAYTRDDLHLEARLKHDTATVKEFAYSESFETWYEMLMFFFVSTADPIVVKPKIVDNMVLNLVHDLRQELAQTAPAR